MNPEIETISNQLESYNTTIDPLPDRVKLLTEAVQHIVDIHEKDGISEELEKLIERALYLIKSCGILSAYKHLDIVYDPPLRELKAKLEKLVGESSQ